MTERERKVILDRVRLLGRTIREILPDDAEMRIEYHEDGRISVTAMKWGDMEGREISKVPRLQIMDTMHNGSEWLSDLSESMNSYFRQNGLLLEEKEEKQSA